MKVALVHDYIKEYGGAERVLEALHEIWSDAPVFTTVYLPEFLGPHKARFNPPAGGWNIKTSWLQFLPFKSKLISPLRLIAPFVFKSFDFSQFDVVIVSATGAYSPNVIQCHPELVPPQRDPALAVISGSNSSAEEMPKRVRHDIRKGPIHISYCHTPPRYLYGFATAREWKNNLAFRILGEIANHFLRLIDFKSAQNVDFFIANSKNVAGRIKKFYRKKSKVIYPPVDTASSSSAFSVQFKNKKLDASLLDARRYFVAGGRIARPKHIDLIIKTFAKLNLPLKIFGRSFANSPNSLITQYPNIQFLGEVSDEEKMELMGQAKAFVFAAEDEDFGITPVEAMSVGTPVIAYRSGGVVESIVHGKTGIFFDELSVESLSKAIKQFSNSTIDPKDCVKHAQKFSKERFKREILEFINAKLKK